MMSMAVSTDSRFALTVSADPLIVRYDLDVGLLPIVPNLFLRNRQRDWMRIDSLNKE